MKPPGPSRPFPPRQLLSRQPTGSEGTAWDFSTGPQFQDKLDWVERFCQDKVEPLDYVFPHAVRCPDPAVKAYVRELQQEVKDQGLWAIFPGRELGGPGFGQLRLALLNEVTGRYAGAPSMFGASAPDTGNMEILAAYGTGEQKKRWLEPLLNQDMFSAFSMTEPQGGSDPDLFKTHAVQDRDEWVINGEKWFTSAGRIADLLFVMCTNGMFVVPRATPGVEIMPEPGNHNHIVYRDVRVPLDHLLGPENGARVLAQRRLGGGRIHHALRTIAQCKLAFDMMCERALSRESHGRIIAGHQMVQEKIAGSCAAIKMLRLFVLETAWKIDQTSTLEARTDIAAVKFTMAKVLREVSCNALHILGSLGTTDLTPSRPCTRRRPPWASPTASTRCTRPPWPAGYSRATAHTRGTGPPSTSRPNEKRRGSGCDPSSTPGRTSPARPRNIPPPAGEAARCRLSSRSAGHIAADKVERRGHGKNFGHATWSAGSCELRQPRTERDGKPVTESNLSLRAPAQIPADLARRRPRTRSPGRRSELLVLCRARAMLKGGGTLLRGW